MIGRSGAGQRAAMGWVLLASLASACAPGKFDELAAAPLDPGYRGLDAATPAEPALDAGLLDTSMPASDAASRSDASLDDDQPGDDVPPGDAGTSCAVSTTQLPTVSKPVVELARLARSPVFTTRVLGPMTRLGDSDHVWTFASARRADGLAAPPATAASHTFVSFDGVYQPWKARSTSKWTLKTSTLESQLPPTLLPLLEGEDAAIALTPSSIIRPGSEARSQLFAIQYDARKPTKVWLATLDDGSVQARRNREPLFSTPPFFAVAARVDGDSVNVYACEPGADAVTTSCFAGRVPAAKIADPSAYQVRARNGSGQWVWSSDLDAGTPVLEQVNGTDLSITYNNYLRRFLAVHGESGSNDVLLRTAQQPWGPWSEPVRVKLPAPRVLYNLGIREHAPLAQDCERRIVLSYFAPTSAKGASPTDGDTVLAAIDLD